jgi:hypothetical protein
MMTISCLPVAEFPEAQLPVAELPAALSPHQNPRLPRSPAVIKPKRVLPILKFLILFGSNAKIGQFWNFFDFVLLISLHNPFIITLNSIPMAINIETEFHTRVVENTVLFFFTC